MLTLVYKEKTMKPEEVGARIRQRRKELKLTQKQIAHSVGCSRVSVTQWEIGDNYPSGAHLIILSKVLGCSTDWIMYGNLSSASSLNGDGAHGAKQGYNFPVLGRLPLISWYEVSDYMQATEAYEQVTVIDYLPSMEVTGPKAFYVVMVGDSMLAPPGSSISLPEGTIILIDPDSTIVIGDFVAALVDGSMVVKKYVQDGSHFYLMPLNVSYSSILADDHCTLLGPVMGTYNRLKFTNKK